jgi:flagellar motility protein MotE (MotC chaperone)
MSEHSLMKTILIAKTLLIVLAVSLYQGWIKIGDVNLMAAGDKATDKATENAAEKSDESGKTDGKSAASEKSSDQNASDKPEKSEQEKAEEGRRKSFLSDLFSLPKLNAKKIQKEEIGKYMDMAERKERQVDERTAQLAKREEQLKALEKSIEDKIIKLEEERKFIAKTLQQEKDLKGERVDKVAELFDKMEPKKAAPAFEKLDKDLTVALFKKLKQKQVTTILENMNPEKSVEITEYFARVKSAREYDILKELNESLRKEFQDCKGMPVTASNDAPPQDGTSSSAKKDDSKTIPDVTKK